MKRNHNSHFHHWPRKLAMVIPIVTISILFLSLLLPLTKPSPSSLSSSSSSSSATWSSLNSTEELEASLPKLAYILSGSKGEGAQLKRVLQAVYHTRNYQLLHLNLEASNAERLVLAKYVKSQTMFTTFGNVLVVGKPDLVTYKGPTIIASTLHGIALLLKKAPHWDWLINLNASDYPLLSHDSQLLSSFLFAFLKSML